MTFKIVPIGFLQSILLFVYKITIYCISLLQVHVNLMVMEARMQAELLYALRTVNRYMTN